MMETLQLLILEGMLKRTYLHSVGQSKRSQVKMPQNLNVNELEKRPH